MLGSSGFFQKKLLGGAQRCFSQRFQITLEKNFQISKDGFFELAVEFHPFVAPQSNSQNCKPLTTEKKLTMALCILNETSSLRITSNSMQIYQVSKTIRVVCKTIKTELGRKCLRLSKPYRRHTQNFRIRDEVWYDPSECMHW